MHELNIGQEIDLEFGGKAKVTGVLDKSGQNTVYIAEYNGMKWALKWFDASEVTNPEKLRQHIKKNISDGEPSNRFIWAKYLTKAMPDGSFGYIMELRPDSFDSFVDILNSYKLVTDPSTGRTVKKTVRFSTLYAMITAVINIVNSFVQLHDSKRCCRDFTDGGLFINTDTGAVLICDCDNITECGSDVNIDEISGYVAPEVICGTAKPDIATDSYMLAVILFKLLFRGDPMEGERAVNEICLTKSAQLRRYGENALFVYDPKDNSNRPVRGIHDNVIKFWDSYPEYIKEYFVRSFTDGVANPEKRITGEEWKRIFIRLRFEIIMCVCGRSNYTSMFEKPDDKTYKCPVCGMLFPTMSFSNTDVRVPLYLGRKFFECEIDSTCDDFLEVAGELVENKISHKLGIKNCSAKSWKAKMPDGAMHDVASGKGCPIWKNLEIDFGEVTAKI